MRWLLALTLSLAAASPALAKKKKPAPSATAKSDAKKGDDKPLPPGDKSANDGAQGRRNATEDAARAADSPQFDHRP